MRILVTSDTHNNYLALKNAILAQPTAEALIHLGDGEGDVTKICESFPKLKIFQVQGNCDYGSTLPKSLEVEIGEKKIFLTHGHLYNVKFNLYSVYLAGKEVGADIVLFGHTHSAMTLYQDGVYIMNPGSLKGYNASYGIIDITDSGIVTNIIKAD